MFNEDYFIVILSRRKKEAPGTLKVSQACRHLREQYG